MGEVNDILRARAKVPLERIAGLDDDQDFED
jgi:hypothetical protein